MVEVTPESAGASTEFFHEATSQGAQLEPVLGRSLAPEFGLQVPVEHLVGIGFGRVERQVEELDLGLALFEPTPHIGGLVHSQVVHNQEELFALRVAHERGHKADEVLLPY